MLVRYTLYGDANLDGSVDLTDFAFLASHFNQTGGATWVNGDSNFDGNVDLTDFTILASNFNLTLPASPASAAALSRTAPLICYLRFFSERREELIAADLSG